MIPEFLLLLACTSATGCEQTFTQYKAYNPVVTHVEKAAERPAGPYGAAYWGPLLAVTFQNEGILNLGKGLNLKLKQQSVEILLSHNF